MDLLKVPKGKAKGKEAKRLVWTPEAERSFVETKKLLAQRLELFIVEPDRPFHMETDVSHFAIGATLKQCDEDGSRTGTVGAMYPVAFFTQKLQSSQPNWSPREKEAYAVFSALCNWDSWIGLQPITVHSDHHSLQHWHSEAVDTPSGPSVRKGQWHELLSKFNLTVLYIPGKDNVPGVQVVPGRVHARECRLKGRNGTGDPTGEGEGAGSRLPSAGREQSRLPGALLRGF